MKLALLGISAAVTRLVEAAISQGHLIEAAYVNAETAADHIRTLRAVVPDIRVRDDWESLLAEASVDAVIVADWLPSLASDVREHRHDQLRKLVGNNIPLLIIPPACEAIVGFELEMIRQDVKGRMLPALPDALHPTWDALLRETEGVELVTWERFLPRRDTNSILAHLARDSERLLRFVGPLRRVIATGASGEGAARTLGGLVVNFEGEAKFPARWMVQPATDFVGATLTLRSPDSTITLRMPEIGPWSLVTAAGAHELEPFDAEAAMVEVLAKHLRGEDVICPTWLESCRALEAVEAAERSLQRGRAIELHNEEHSEQSSFRGIMAVGGCLMLLITLGAIIGVAILSAVFRPKDAGAGFWSWLQVCLVVPIVFFLLLQLLSFGLGTHQRKKQAGP